jgi:hypothetical protein
MATARSNDNQDKENQGLDDESRRQEREYSGWRHPYLYWPSMGHPISKASKDKDDASILFLKSVSETAAPPLASSSSRFLLRLSIENLT